MNDKLFCIYLNDRLALATIAVRLARRCRATNQDTPLETDLNQIVDLLERVHAALKEVLEQVGGSVNLPKQMGAAVAEFAGRFKPNGRLTGYSPLSRLVEIEALLGLLHTLATSLETVDATRGLGLADSSRDLIIELERAADGLSAHRHEAARAAFESA